MLEKGIDFFCCFVLSIKKYDGIIRILKNANSISLRCDPGNQSSLDAAQLFYRLGQYLRANMETAGPLALVHITKI